MTMICSSLYRFFMSAPSVEASDSHSSWYSFRGAGQPVAAPCNGAMRWVYRLLPSIMMAGEGSHALASCDLVFKRDECGSQYRCTISGETMLLTSHSHGNRGAHHR